MDSCPSQHGSSELAEPGGANFQRADAQQQVIIYSGGGAKI